MQSWLIVTLLLQSALISIIAWYVYTVAKKMSGQTVLGVPPAPEQHLENQQIQRLLAIVSRSLHEHAGELGRFEESLETRSSKPSPRGADWGKIFEEMHESNQKVEKSIDSTVASIAGACGEMLAEEKSGLEGYRSRTEAFDSKLGEVDREHVLAAITSKLVDMVRELRQENVTVRTGLDNAKDKVIELMARAHSAEQMARTDSLTRLPNRRVFEESHNEQHESFERTGVPYAVVLMDLDHFKVVNDRYGHQVGDAVLAMVGQVYSDSRRTDDYLCRMGGEEFALLLTKCNLETAMRVADRYRQKIEAATLRTHEHQVSVTVSCGVAVVRHNESKGQVLKRADLALYDAKVLGRNRVCATASPTEGAAIAPVTSEGEGPSIQGAVHSGTT